MKKIKSIVDKTYFPYLSLILVTVGIYYKLFIFGNIPFPGDLLVVSYSPWLDYYKFPVQNPLISDVFSQFFLWKNLAMESLKNFEWPLWNPYSFTGNPLLATYHSATLYPLNILLLLPNFGWGLFIYSQTLIAALTFYLFISQIVKSKIAGLSGSVMFSLGSLMTTWLEIGTAGHTMAWIPLALYSIKKFSSIQKFRFALILTASLSLIILAGNAQVTTYSFSIVFLYILWLRSFPLLLTLVIPLGITALQLLPSFDLLNNSIRLTESYIQDANFGLLNIKDVFKFFIPDYFGNPVTRNYWGTLNYLETSGYLGILTLPLLIYAVFKIRSKDSFFFFVLFIISLLFVFDNPLSRLIYNLKIPLLTSSYASRMLFITLLSISVISSLAINHILEHKNAAYFKKTILWSWSVIVGIILGTLFTYYSIENILNYAPNKTYLEVYLNNGEYALQNFITATRNSLIPLIFVTVALLLSIMLNKTKKLNLLMGIFFILVIFDLGRYFLKFNPFVPQELVFPVVPALEFLQRQPGIFRVGREHAEVFPPNTWIAYDIPSIEGYDPIYLNQFGRYINFLNGGDIRSGSANRYAELLNYQSPFLDTSNVKYFIGIGRDRTGHIPGNFVNYKFNETRYKQVFKDGSAIIFENPDVLERVFLAKDIAIAKTEEIENIFMTDKDFDPRITTLLSEDLQISKVTGLGDAKITHYSSNLVKVQTNTSSEEILVLADQYEESWKATIDNQETIISPANLIFRAIKVPAGFHEVVFRYYPSSFDAGLKISVISLMLFLLISMLALKTQKF